ncbi:T9SS type A sorting domain-containing protein [uncultured Flavobacterium sp.]|uniref:T9SS type A sorting domain-containing protein n=1 Tax=uncultured Flavobacterium sp. TaxID=165435 RepID=UPI002596EE7A|nr:T9SS type A sorting domain-containing protein [uncultured Flavobacterium sp.]
MQKFLFSLCFMTSFQFYAQQLELDNSYAVSGINATGLQSYNIYTGDGEGISNSPFFMEDKSILIPYSLNPYYSAQFPNLAPTIGIKKYLENGSLDTTFGNNGTALFTANFHADRFNVYGVTIQSDGKIILVGRTHRLGVFSRDYQTFICRLNANGTADTTFGTNGLVKLNMYVENSADSNDERFVDVAVDNQNRIVAVGYTYWYLGSSLYDGSAIAYRFLSNGTIDTSFATNGKLELSLTAIDNFTNIYKSGDDYILLGNTNPTRSQNDFLITKIDTDGNLVSSFGVNGISQIDFGGNVSAVKIFFENNNKMMVTGLKIGSGLAFAKINSDGSLDNAFSLDGKNTTNLPVPNHYPIGSETYPGITSNHISRLPDNKYILVSTVRYVNSYDYAIACLNDDTTLNLNFMTNGIYLNDIAAFDWARALHVQNDGKIVVLVGSTLFKYLNFSTLNLNSLDATVFNVSVFPNPTYNQLYVNKLANEIIVSDITGKIFLNFQQVDEINLSALKNGVYFVNLYFENGIKIVKKIVKN